MMLNSGGKSVCEMRFSKNSINALHGKWMSKMSTARRHVICAKFNFDITMGKVEFLLMHLWGVPGLLLKFHTQAKRV
jgi:hypothetical protein